MGNNCNVCVIKKKSLNTLRTYGDKTWVIRADGIEGLHENIITNLRAVPALRYVIRKRLITDLKIKNLHRVVKRNKSGPVREEVTGWWRTLHHELQDLIMIVLIMQYKLCTSYTILFRLANKKSEMGRARGILGSKEKYIQGFDEETWRKETTW